ncbi:hypothetical protein [Flavobacterium degerlachei]|jgi:hypothetical protein|uniref:Uncharacterized protein n=1 Tax=Flavobacterium degerlachei TaxID=229203 RepID=A0A1H2SJ30_9FLAO|nr:hypothetical protein [Flavobacterium degerlachei]SDW31646.1 hypothetical protein SAMN05444338_10293 [Flavobacterium degerlachei]
MKLIARIFLFLFIVFLATPTVVTMVKKSCDTSRFFSLSEEEHTQKEIKVFTRYDEIQVGFLIGKNNKSSLILSENLSKHDNVTASIFCPPPDLA